MELTYVDVHQKEVSPHELAATFHISCFPEPKESRLNDGGAPAGFQIREENLL